MKRDDYHFAPGKRRVQPGEDDCTLVCSILISSAQAPNCAIALDTSRNDKAAQTDKIFSI